MDKSYNKFERAYEIMKELTQAPLPIEPTELGEISTKELQFLSKTLEMMADYLDAIGFDFIGIKEESLTPIYEELETRVGS
ncbi:hypothetical protein JJB27_03715 [Campylobacter fetus subsp. venerealis]|uniref:hypothetical protein n=1 Tax=Campylobacter fetus TaxID=196 RepID=UPI000818C433|nr:hypothetical protein [Campylobacter fetus]MBK3498184.1 hypothetical protein [Campylobacter fetus subsp. venerealis]MBK3502184.1 hypothetical protein [Campylobacter fetus subsp. venerealis]OCS16820.1 hypothetical protein CfvWBT01109_01930 [Campylobacter fetus subsp. venerealis]